MVLLQKLCFVFYYVTYVLRYFRASVVSRVRFLVSWLFGFLVAY